MARRKAGSPPKGGGGRRGNAPRAGRKGEVASAGRPGSASAPAQPTSRRVGPSKPDGAARAGRAGDATKRVAPTAASSAEVPRRALESTPTIVLKAASIIEEEVAKGIGAVKRIEQRFLDVDVLRSQHPDHVMARFRKDAHEAVDIILDIVTAAATTVGEHAGKMVNVTASRMTQSDGSAPHGHDDAAAAGAGLTRLPVVRMPGTVAAGTEAELVMSLENDSDHGTAEFTLNSSELVSASGARISASCVVFSPATLAVGPRSKGSVTVRIKVPQDAKAGSYEGLMRATQVDGLRAMLAVNVS